MKLFQNGKFFSQLSKIKKYFPEKEKIELRQKELKNQENKIYDGMDLLNTDTVSKINKNKNKFFPLQHPTLIHNEDCNIISYRPPVRNLTPYNRIMPEAYHFEEPEFQSPIDSKELDICILGAANSGKSSLINCILGDNVSAVSSKYNTTTENLKGIFTDNQDKTQLIFWDTPGVIKTGRHFNSRKILTKAWEVVPECDKIIFLVDAVKKLEMPVFESIKLLLKDKILPSTLRYINLLKSSAPGDFNMDLDAIDDFINKNKDLDDQSYESKNISTILVLNKVDLVTNKRRLRRLEDELHDTGAFEKTFYVSCKTGYGIEELKSYLKAEALRRPWRHHPDVKTTQPDVERAEEMLRQLIFNRFNKELPYESMCRVTSWVPMTNGELKINFSVECKRKIHISMMIGDNSRVVKEIREEIQRILTDLFKRPVKANIFLNLRKGGHRTQDINERATFNY